MKLPKGGFSNPLKCFFVLWMLLLIQNSDGVRMPPAYNPYFTRRQLQLQPQARQHQHQDVPAVIKDDHIMPNVKEGLDFMGEKVAENVDMLAEVVMGTEAKTETAKALETLHHAVMPNEKQPNQPNLSYPPSSHYEPAHYYSTDLIQPRHEFPNSVRLQQPASTSAANPFTVEEALYVLGKNILGKNVTDRIFPVAKTIAKGVGQVGQGLSTFGELLPPVEFDGSPLKLLPGAIIQDEDEYLRNQQEQYQNLPRIEREQIPTPPPRCTTPTGGSGKCMDIQNCPILLADLGTLRKSICFKSLFVPGVCCPDQGTNLVQEHTISSGSQNGGGGGDLPPNTVVAASEGEDFDIAQIQPQGTTKRPFDIPSLADLSTTTPKPSPLLQESFSNVPNSRQECGLTKIPQGRIVGGNATFEGEHPWMAAIYLHGSNRKEFWCGGALIAADIVITAAHCTKDAKKRPFRPRQFSVKVGEWNLADSDTYSAEFRVVLITAHPDFKANGFYSDVALFKLDQPVRFSEYIQPICLPSGPLITRDFTGALPVVLGWGTTHYGGEEVSTLRGVALPVWTRSDCDQAYFQPITEVFLCAGFADGGKDACQGDSGGPLVLYDEVEQRWVLLGIVSFGNRCAEPGYPGVYTKVTHFMPWILANV